MTESEVFGAIEGFALTVVTWTDASADGSESSPIDWSIIRAEGDAMTVTYDPTTAESDVPDSCVARTGIAIPVVVEASVAGGHAFQSWRTDLEGFGSSMQDIELLDEDVLSDDVRAELSDEWSAACSEEGGWGGSLDDAWITYDGTFESQQFAIFGGSTAGDGTRRAFTCWYGVLGEMRVDAGASG